MIDYEEIREELEREEKVDSASEYLEKVNRIKKEKNRLKRTLKEIDKSKKSAVESAINDVIHGSDDGRSARKHYQRWYDS